MAVQEVNLEMVDLLRPYFLSKPQAGEVIIIPGEIQLDPLYVDNIYEKTADHGVNIDGALAKDGGLTADPLYVDTINEKTAAHGVIVDGVLIKDTTIDVNGAADAVILDADGDTTISAPTDDQIDIEIAGADDFVFVANIFRALSGSQIQTNTINETTAASGVTVDGVLLKDTTVDVNGTADAIILDADGDTTISAPTEDQIDVEINGADDFTFTANTFTALSGSTIKTDTIGETTAAAGVTIDGVLLKDTTVDVNGTADAFILDADADTTISAPTDDQIDFEVGGTDRMSLTATGLSLASGARLNEFSTDGTLAGNSDTAAPTEKAVKTYADNLISSSAKLAIASKLIENGTGIRGFWPMSAVDASGNVVNTTGLGNMSYNGNPVYGLYNDVAPYIELDGTGDYLSAADNAVWDILGTETYIAIPGLTFGGWFWFDTVALGGEEGVTFVLIDKFQSIAIDHYRLSMFDGTGRLTAQLGGGSISPATAMSPNAWYFLVAKLTPGSEEALLINTTWHTETSGVDTAITDNTGALTIGATSTGGSPHDGKIAMAFVAAAAWPDSYIESIYNYSKSAFGH